jgi:hypothetical protein
VHWVLDGKRHCEQACCRKTQLARDILLVIRTINEVTRGTNEVTAHDRETL